MAKDILKSSITYTILGFLPLSFSFLFTPIYLRYLSAAEYGLLNLFMLYSGFLAQFFNLGISTAFGYSYWDVYKDKSKLNTLISTTIVSILIIQLLFALVLGLSSDFIFVRILKVDGSFAHPEIIQLLFVFSACSVFYELFLYLFRNEEKLISYSTLSLSTLIMLTAGTLLTVVYFGWEAIGAMLGRTIAYAAVVIYFFILIIRRTGFSFKFRLSKKLLKFGYPIFINSIIGAIVFGADRLFIERYSTLENLGIYGFALVVITVIEVWFNALNNAISPTLYRLMNEAINEKKDDIRGLADLILISVLILIGLINLLFLPILDLIFPEVYRSASLYIPILSVAFIWRALSAFNTYSIYLKKETKYLLVNQLINLLVFLIVVFPLFNQFQLSGIAMAVLITRFTDFLILKLVSNRLKRLPFKMFKYGAIATLLSVAAILINRLTFWDVNPYLLNTIPLIIAILSCSIILKTELPNLKRILYNRKELF